MEYTHIVLSGGSLKCLTSLGCLRYHERAGHLEHVHCFVGVSAGAILCLLLSVGFTTDDIIKLVYQQVIPHALQGLNLDSVLSLPDTYGIDNGSAYMSILQKALHLKLFEDTLTFQELYEKTGHILAVGVTNVALHVTEYWDKDTQPGTPVMTAVHASISIPLLFQPVWHGGYCYVDGGVLNNFPLEYVPSHLLSTTLAIEIVSESRKECNDTDQWSLLDYIRELLFTVTSRPRAQIVCDTLLTIAVTEPTDQSLYCFSVDGFKFEMTQDTARQYIQQGYSVAKCNYETRVRYTQQ